MVLCCCHALLLLQEWGWVQEMYGFAIGAWLGGIKKFDLFLHMMAQPPWDTNVRRDSEHVTCMGAAGEHNRQQISSTTRHPLHSTSEVVV